MQVQIGIELRISAKQVSESEPSLWNMKAITVTPSTGTEDKLVQE